MKKSLPKVMTPGGVAFLERCRLATGFWDRLVGLLATESLEAGEGIFIGPCKQVHTFFMRFPIDAVFVDGEDRVVAIESLAPWRVSGLHWRAKGVYETPVGHARRLAIRVGEKLELRSC